MKYIVDKFNFADLRLLFLAVNFKVNLGESLRRRIFEYSIRLLSRKSTYPQLCQIIYNFYENNINTIN